jgi:hypothetical protein
LAKYDGIIIIDDPEMLAKSAARLDRILPRAARSTSERAGTQPARG